MNGANSSNSSTTGNCCPARNRTPNWLIPYKQGSRNFVSACLSTLALILLTTSLGETNWFYLRGAACNTESIGLVPFFFNGNFIYTDRPHSTKYVYYNMWQIIELSNCLTPDIVVTLKTSLVLLFVAILSTTIQIVLDLLGSDLSVLKALQTNAVFSIITVLICVTVNGLCFWAGKLLQQLQENIASGSGSNINQVPQSSTLRSHFRQQLPQELHPQQPVEVIFATGFYMMVAAGAICVLAAGANCFKQPLTFYRMERRERLLSHRRRRLPSRDRSWDPTGGARLPTAYPVMPHADDVEHAPPSGDDDAPLLSATTSTVAMDTAQIDRSDSPLLVPPSELDAESQLPPPYAP